VTEPDKSDSNHAGEDSQDLAIERTDLAEDRTVLAHERSFASWLRTGLASVGIAIAFNALFKSLEPAWVAKAIATVFLAIAIVIFISANRRTNTVISRLQAHEVAALKPVRANLISWAFVLATIALGAAMWLLIEA
jgi:inner membrane protein YidH